MAAESTTQTPERAAFYQRIAGHSLAPLWEVLHGLVTPTPQTPCVPALWRYDEIRPFLMEAGSLITAREAERRVLILPNPAIHAPPPAPPPPFPGLHPYLPA